MREKENRPDAATSEQLTMGDVFGEDPFSSHQYNTFDGDISSILSVGQENAVNLKYLMKITGMDNRTVRKTIEDERRRGIPICADCVAGYYLPTTEDEKMRCVRSMRHRATEIFRTAKAIEEAAPDGRC